MHVVENPDFYAVRVGPNEANETNPDAVFLHGFLGSHRSGVALAQELAKACGWTTMLVDLPFHGMQGRTNSIDDFTYPGLARYTMRLAEEIDFSAVCLIGHSMGGKIAMRAVVDGLQVQQLAILDIAPVRYAPDRQTADVVAAAAQLDPGQFDSRRAIDQKLAETVPEPAIRQFVMTNIVRQRVGDQSHYQWRIDMKFLAEHIDAILDWPEADGSFNMPAHLIYGAQSDYVRPQGMQAFQTLFPQAVISGVDGATHWVHYSHAKQVAAIVCQGQG